MNDSSRSAVLAMLLAATPLAGQAGTTSHALARGDHTVEQTTGFSWFSPGGSWGDVTNRRVYLTGVRASWVLGVRGRFAVAYAAELMPIAIVERTQPNSRTCWFTSTGQNVCRIDMSSRVAVGAGGSPLGVRVYVNNGERWRAHATAAFGALMFSNEMPIYDSHVINFSIEYGGGVDFGTASGRQLTLGFRFNHFSNGGMGRLNPGLDANVVYLGVTRRRPR